MATVRDLVTGAGRLFGLVASGEALDASQAREGLAALNGIVEQWNIEELAVPGVSRSIVTCTPGKSPHTIGIGGDWSQAQPPRIEEAFVSFDGYELPVQILSRDEYAATPTKAEQGLPLALYYEPGASLGSVYLWPIPSQAFSLSLWAWDQITAFAHLDDTVTLPQGYEKALRYALAVEWAAEFGLEASATVVQIATNSKAAIKRMNYETPVLTCDPALTSGHAFGLSGFLGGL